MNKDFETEELPMIHNGEAEDAPAGRNQECWFGMGCFPGLQNLHIDVRDIRNEALKIQRIANTILMMEDSCLPPGKRRIRAVITLSTSFGGCRISNEKFTKDRQILRPWQESDDEIIASQRKGKPVHGAFYCSIHVTENEVYFSGSVAFLMSLGSACEWVEEEGFVSFRNPRETYKS